MASLSGLTTTRFVAFGSCWGLFLIAWLTTAGSAARASPGKVAEDVIIDETGLIAFPNGTRWDPFEDAMREPPLPKDAFVCHDGHPFGVHLPAMGGRPKQFIYTASSVGERHFWPLQFLQNRASIQGHFILVPPLGSSYPEWSFFVMWLPQTLTDPATQHVFSVGEEHPCGPAGDWEAELAKAISGLATAPQQINRKGAKALWDFAAALAEIETSQS
mmetsp:Transcript_56219/g.162962  ORF Transcript_56219/g.162962 Transcript_56219/m.162962 type:complete len:217 (+) Transcript_56219:33-683(+)|eukprot:CAMPEP_0176089290 /NCGR_PEP_ID=MMETSP0120_2-20121206/44717_1 /TAXON_ID=160619 /ORGANISM="Kryptoperidinium foliaceum, Strain CCMP 1326" /LENGTH=216 /DNA_ID=CAMNT_0017423167 /DNA_START=33 /DNA_END=683 /DNA_ORIENTATION=+